MDYSETEIRRLCNEYVLAQIKQYMITYNRWGLLSDWRNSYFTFSSAYTSIVLNTFSHIAETLFEQDKPFLWSVRRQAQVDVDQVDDIYVDKPATFIKLRITNEKEGYYLLAFTCDPWSLSSC
jgi:isoleucyl-tRNA synthetase